MNIEQLMKYGIKLNLIYKRENRLKLDKPLISIIIPVYNVEQYVTKCVESVINQTYKNIQIILIDDGSTDNSGKICDDFKLKDNRIEVIHKKNGGLSDARNAGLKIVKGDYIGFVDSDDYIAADMYETMLSLIIENNSDISIVSFLQYENGSFTQMEYTNELIKVNSLDGIKYILMDKKIPNYSWNKLFKKKIFDNITFPTGRKFEDIATTYKLFENADNIVFKDTPKYYYIRRNDSITKTKNYDNYKDYVDILMERYRYLENEYGSKIQPYNDYGLINNMLWYYTVLSSFDIKELEPKFMNIYDELTKKIDLNLNFLKNNLNEYNITILKCMRNDNKESRKVVKELYFNSQK